MSEIDLDIQTTEDSPPESRQSDWPAPGQKLKKIREDMGLSHARVADALHMTAHYVKALENDEYDKLPGKTFVKGYFRSYAKLLGADVEETMQCYQHYNAALEESEVSQAKDMRARRVYDQNVRWLICAAIIIVVVIGVSWWFARGNNSDAADTGSTNPVVAEMTTVNEVPVTAEMLVATLDRNATAATGAARSRIVTTSSQGSGTISMATTATEVQAESPQDYGNTVLVPAIADIEAVFENETTVILAEEVDTVDATVDTTVANEATTAIEPVVVVENSAFESQESTLPEYTVTQSANRREVALESEGNDLLEVHFSGASWIEVDNGDNTRLYNDMLRMGDVLTIKGKAPFNILFGDANVVNVTFNSRSLDVLSRIRSDNSARITLAPETR